MSYLSKQKEIKFKVKTVIQCCFCSETGKENILRLVVSNVDDYDYGEQLLFCHARCLKKVIDKNIPVLFDEDNQG